MTRRNSRRRTGLTLVELLLVIGILLVLGTVSVVAYTRIKAGADADATKAKIDAIESAIDLFYSNMSRYPATLAELVEQPEDEAEQGKWRGPYLTEKTPTDAWGREFMFEAVDITTLEAGDKPCRIWSTGADGIDGSEDDVRNWTEAE